ncbi:MAG: hypothetical protein QXE50_05765 [Nitrososphaerota archaeon]
MEGTVKDVGGPRLQCSNCGRIYTFYELFNLPRVPVNPEDPERYGYTMVCMCGKRFYLDKWGIKDEVKIRKGRKLIGSLLVSTTALEVEHPDGMWYETMIFPQGDIETVYEYMWRYKTKEEAEKGHKRIVESLKNGKYRITRDKFYRVELVSEY